MERKDELHAKNEGDPDKTSILRDENNNDTSGSDPGETVKSARRQRNKRKIIKIDWESRPDYALVNKFRKRRRYVKVEISEEQYFRLREYVNEERIPMRYFVTRAVEFYLNQWGQYGWSEVGYLRNITPFDDD